MTIPEIFNHKSSFPKIYRKLNTNLVIQITLIQTLPPTPSVDGHICNSPAPLTPLYVMRSVIIRNHTLSSALSSYPFPKRNSCGNTVHHLVETRPDDKAHNENVAALTFSKLCVDGYYENRQ